ncbi:MAG TPA: tetratricopeptide repeat protein [Flavobacteriales bacterium]|nr:tetratricopeptide repeat protein [Flavobacteriales bacterium]
MKNILLVLLALLLSGMLFAQKSAFAWYFEGNKMLFRKDYPAAIEAYDKAILLNPNADYAWFNRGNAKFEQVNYKSARLDYNKTILLNPEYAEAFYGRGLCKIFMGDQDAGCKDLKKADRFGFKPAKDAINEHCRK